MPFVLLLGLVLSNLAQATCADAVTSPLRARYTSHAVKEFYSQADVADASIQVVIGNTRAEWIENVGMRLHHGFGPAIEVYVKGFRSDLPRRLFRSRRVSHSYFHFLGGDPQTAETLRNLPQRFPVYRTQDGNHLLYDRSSVQNKGYVVNGGTGGFVQPVPGGFDVYAWKPETWSGKYTISVIGIRTSETQPTQLTRVEVREYWGALLDESQDTPIIDVPVASVRYVSDGPFVRTEN